MEESDNSFVTRQIIMNSDDGPHIAGFVVTDANDYSLELLSANVWILISK